MYEIVIVKTAFRGRYRSYTNQTVNFEAVRRLSESGNGPEPDEHARSSGQGWVPRLVRLGGQVQHHHPNELRVDEQHQRQKQTGTLPLSAEPETDRETGTALHREAG